MIKIIYTKSCFFESVFAESKDICFNFKYDSFLKDEDKELIKKDLNLYKQVLLKLFVYITPFELKKLSNYYFNNYSLVKNIENFNLEKDSDFYTLFNLLKDCIEFVPSSNKINYNSCETCGDCNYVYEISII